ncbi:transglutaminase family protein [Haloferula rosea]|uniref:Protein SirB1 N-terminal domain-containing protein n=1 Tax=Haloferula rosea TaxID=490093 RepID=A0A934RAE8_9BACT|nr:transglutaminase family protein [Haloferula rosea]MBK1826988.1 hypothetical protein [Haloferula rosea]
MPTLLPTADTLSTLLRLIDDETPEVRQSLAEALEVFEGDVSELLTQTSYPASDADLKVLSDLLRSARRERLRREWVVPSNGINGLADDWDRVESLFRVLSDYLHDGTTVRQPLGDALDLLAEETEAMTEGRNTMELCQYLLKGNPLKCETRTDLQPEFLDLARVAAGGSTCPLGAGVVILLVLRRLRIEADGLSLPGTFFLRVDGPDGPVILDPEHGGEVLRPRDFEHRIRRYPKEIQTLCRRAATPGELLVRTTEELAMALAFRGDGVDGDLMEELVESLVPVPF